MWYKDNLKTKTLPRWESNGQEYDSKIKEQVEWIFKMLKLFIFLKYPERILNAWVNADSKIHSFILPFLTPPFLSVFPVNCVNV